MIASLQTPVAFRSVIDSSEPGRRALVTGASSGIGKAFAEKLAAMGWDLVLVARDTARLEALASRFTEDHGVSAIVAPADLTQAADLRRTEALIRGDERLRLAINNAGVSYVEPLATADPDRLEAMIQLNVTALVRLTQAALPGMLARGEGAIVEVSSAGAFVCPADSAAYCATKGFVNNFTEALAAELAGKPVQIQALCPGMTVSELADRGGFDVSWVPSWMSAEDVVDACFAGLRLNEVVCVPGLQDADLVKKMRGAGLAVVGQTIRSVVAPRYRSPVSATSNSHIHEGEPSVHQALR